MTQGIPRENCWECPVFYTVNLKQKICYTEKKRYNKARKGA